MVSLARNTFWLTISKTLSVAVYALFGLLLPRLVSPEVNGLYTLMSTLLFFGGMAATFGIPTILVRTVAREPERAPEIWVRARTAMLGGALLSALVVLAYLVLEMAVQGHFDSRRMLLGLLVGGILLGDAAGSLGESFCQAHEDMVLPARLEIASGLLRGGGALAVLFSIPGSGLLGVYLCFLVGALLRGAILPWVARRRHLHGVDLPPAAIRPALRLLRESLAFALFRMLRMLRNRVDSLLLGLILVPAAGMSLMEASDDARALFGQAMRVVFVFHTLTLALNTAVFPRLVRLTADHTRLGEARRQFTRVVRYQAWWSSLLAALVFVYADGLASWFGPVYHDGIPGLYGTTGGVLRLLSVAVLLDCIGGPVGMLMIGRPSMDRFLPFFGGALAGLNLILNLILIPRYGIIGAAWASVGASILEILLKIPLTRFLLGTARPLAGVLPYLLLAAATAAALHFSPLGTSPLLGGLLGAPLYFLLSWRLMPGDFFPFPDIGFRRRGGGGGRT